MTEISWTNKTWNPIVGCSKKSVGCSSCYAISQAFRNDAMGKRLEGPGRLAYYDGLTEKRGDRVEWTGKVNFVPEALEIPLKRKKPTKWFVNSMSDLFHESVADEWIDKIFAVMALTPQHVYQILTKRPERMQTYVNGLTTRSGGIRLAGTIARLGSEFDCQTSQYYALIKSLRDDGGSCLPLPNCWLGVTVENQKAADERIPLLLNTPAAIRFLSCEPLLEEISLAPWLAVYPADRIYNQSIYGHPQPISWAICGGESGPKSRPCNVKWLQSIVDQCNEAKVPVWMKQLGSNCKGLDHGYLGKGTFMVEWPESLRVQQFPEV
jgi:protein gp37